MSRSQPTPCTATRTPQCMQGWQALAAAEPRPAAWSGACLRDRALESAQEQALVERTAALERSNRDLDAFARDLAHEMRTPIGQLEAIAELMLKCNGTQSESERAKWLRLQLSAARRMRATVQALLDEARWGLAPTCRVEVDLSALCETARSQLDDSRHRAPIDWHIAPGMVLQGSTPHIDLLMRNLLSNAVKYTRHAEAPRICVTLRRCGDLQAVAVEDNGAGFDEAGAARLFQPFVRLHDQADYEGTGLGLSLVKRIVERHGGCIRASGEPGRGARFEFVLGTPPAQAVQAAAVETGPGSISVASADTTGDWAGRDAATLSLTGHGAPLCQAST
jgi:signal transduction histidine kinase